MKRTSDINRCFRFLGDELVCYRKDHGFNSHGRWSTFGQIQEDEVERGNPFPEGAVPHDTLAIWIAETERIALRYARPAEEWDQIEDLSVPLTEEQREALQDIVEIPLKKSDKVVWADGDGGYLLVRPG